MPNDLFPMGEGGSVGNGQKGLFFHGTKNSKMGAEPALKCSPTEIEARQHAIARAFHTCRTHGQCCAGALAVGA